MVTDQQILKLLTRIRDGQRLPMADREQDKIRQKARRMGLVFNGGQPRRWRLTDKGREFIPAIAT